MHAFDVDGIQAYAIQQMRMELPDVDAGLPSCGTTPPFRPFE